MIDSGTRTTPHRVNEWATGTVVIVLWNVLGLVLVIVGLALFAGVHATRGGETGFTLTGTHAFVGLTVTFVLSVGLIVAHEGLHGLAMRRFGAQPRYGAGLLAKSIPYLSCTTAGRPP